MNEVTIQKFNNKFLDQLYDLMMLCRIPEWYTVAAKRECYEEVALNGLSICASCNDKLVGILLCCLSQEYLSNWIDKINVLQTKNTEYITKGLNFMNSCVHPDYRGNNLEECMIRMRFELNEIENLNSSIKFCWCTAHPDNTASVRSILKTGFERVLYDVPFYNIDGHTSVFIKII